MFANWHLIGSKKAKDAFEWLGRQPGWLDKSGGRGFVSSFAETEFIPDDDGYLEAMEKHASALKVES